MINSPRRTPAAGLFCYHHFRDLTNMFYPAANRTTSSEPCRFATVLRVHAQSAPVLRPKPERLRRPFMLQTEGSPISVHEL